jgi:serine/threonine-protein kinase SRPK3
VDLGNACWKHHHFSTEIQTRQYRSPEVIIGVNYNETADIWSFACTIFEMLTGDFLFEPKNGPNFDKDDDHLAQIIELVSKVPKKFALSGLESKKFFDKKGNLRKIQGFHFWPLKSVLTEKYHLVESEAKALAEFLIPMLNYYPNKRIQAREALKSKWLTMPNNPKYKLTPQEIRLKQENRNKQQDLYFSNLEDLDNEDFEASSEDNKSVDKNSDFGDEDHDNYGYDKLLNTSFQKGGYVPYGGGIDFEELDQDPNWQFIDSEKIINVD